MSEFMLRNVDSLLARSSNLELFFVDGGLVESYAGDGQIAMYLPLVPLVNNETWWCDRIL